MRKKIVYILFLLAVLLLTLLAGEGLFRMMGRQPYRPWKRNFTIEPGGRLTQGDPVLGYTYMPGRYVMCFNNRYRVTMTHRENTLRITRPLENYRPDDTRPAIWLFGCSFTYGYALNDNETFPWLLQERFPEYDVVNFGVGGYGDVQSLLQLRAALASGKTPAVAVLNYAAFHDYRNVFIRQHQKYAAPLQELGPRRFPCASLDKDGHLEISSKPYTYFEIPLMRWSALIHSLEEKYNQIQSAGHREHEVSREVIRAFMETCREHGVVFILSGISRDKGTREMLSFWETQDVATVDISVDLGQKGFMTPAGNHPSALADRFYADKLETSLRSVLEK